MTKLTFSGSFTQQAPISEDAILAAVEVMRSGRLHRYNVADGEEALAAILERRFAEWQGASYCLALASGGQAIQIALRAAGVGSGDRVLTNAFTLAPVPGAIHSVGAMPVLVETDQDLRININDLAEKAVSSGADYLLLSHMRGHLCDMDLLMQTAERVGFKVIEDCAHTMGAFWNKTRSGNHGLAACFSAQTYKHINAGEGGLLTSNDADFMARATIMSGSYMLHQRHGAGPDIKHFSDPRLNMPNLSARMDNLRAAILIPQIDDLDTNVKRWNERYRTLEKELRTSNTLVVPQRPVSESYVGSSIQFRAPNFDSTQCEDFVKKARAKGVELKWFGADEPNGFTSSHRSWRYLPEQHLPGTDKILSTLFDMRIPLTFSIDDCKTIGRILRDIE